MKEEWKTENWGNSDINYNKRLFGVLCSLYFIHSGDMSSCISYTKQVLLRSVTQAPKSDDNLSPHLIAYASCLSSKLEVKLPF